MLKSQRLNVIQKIAEKKEDESVISFGQCKSKLSAMENQLKKLYQYREDYNSQFNQTASSGIKSSNIQDYLKFINNLNHNDFEKLKLDWIEKNRQVKIYSNVKSKLVENELTEKLKQEQKDLDESSTAFFLRNKS